MTNGGKRTALFHALGGLVLLLVALICQLPFTVIIDPMEGGEGAVQRLLLLAQLASFAFGSVAMALFMRAKHLMTGQLPRSRRDYAVRGAVFVVLAAALLVLMATARTTQLWLILPLLLVLLYSGGGYLVLACRRASQAR